MLRAEGVVVRFPDPLRCGPKTQSPPLVKGPTRSAAPRASCTTFVGFAPSMSTGPNCSCPCAGSTEPAVTRNGVRWR
ncbi:hypothetical protein LA080_010267 [Diaporthe eres]|nr:hypothetical protein LA080_010267 [Diaporthe eres]